MKSVSMTLERSRVTDLKWEQKSDGDHGWSNLRVTRRRKTAEMMIMKLLITLGVRQRAYHESEGGTI